MSKLYTLRTKLTGDAANMNGKIFKGKIDKFNQITFIDVATEAVLRQTTSIVSREEKADGILLTTKSGSIYDLIDVTSLIPTASFNKKIPAVEEVQNIPLSPYTVNEIKRFDLDNYRDGSNLKIITSFNKDHGITNIGELLRAVTMNDDSLSEEEIRHAYSLLKMAGFKVSTDKDNVDITFIGFPNIVNTSKVRPIGHVHTIRHANYCDAWKTNYFIFDKCNEVDEKDFIEFCEANNLKIKEKGAWYESYSVIEQDHDGWVYRWVDPYTD